MSEIRIIEAPDVYLIGRQSVDEGELARFLADNGSPGWTTDAPSAGERLAETGGRLCFDDQTEALTPWGWKKFSEVTEDTPLATMNPETKAFEFSLPREYHVYDFEGDLLAYDGRDISFAVTPEHRQFAARSAKHGFGEFGFERTDELLSSRSFQVMTAPASWQGSQCTSVGEPSVWYRQRIANQFGATMVVAEKKSKPFEVVGVAEVQALTRLIAHYVANGSVAGQKGTGQGIVIYGREDEEVRGLAARLGLPASKWVDPRNQCPRVIIGGGMAVAEYFRRACGQGCHNKCLPGWMLNLPAVELQAVWDILVKTDGHRTEAGRELFLTGSDRMADQSQELLAKLGFSSYATTTPGTNGPCHVIAKKRGIPAKILSSRVRRLPYSGKVYCVTTDNGIVYVRRNGKVHFSGNCYQSFKKPRPGGNAAYLGHILEVGHGSVLEHAVWTLIITGISRRCCEQLTRQRVGFSPSQLSQRYVDEVEGGVLDVVISPAMAKYYPEYKEWTAAMDAWEDAEDQDYDLMPHPSDGVAMIDDWAAQMRRAARAYEENAERIYDMLSYVKDKTSRRKRAREAARDVLPNATETKIQVTTNARSLRHFFEMRGAAGADEEIRRLALALLPVLQHASPHLFADYETPTVDGVRIIQTPHRKV